MATTAIQTSMCQGSSEHLFSKMPVSSVLPKAMVKINEKPWIATAWLILQGGRT